MARYECDGCGAAVEVRQGKKTGLAFWNCANCGLRVSVRPGTKAFQELASAGLVKEIG